MKSLEGLLKGDVTTLGVPFDFEDNTFKGDNLELESKLGTAIRFGVMLGEGVELDEAFAISTGVGSPRIQRNL